MEKIHRLYLEGITSPSNTYGWIPMDSEELFNQNIKKYPNDISLNYYLKNPIEYKLNNYGFRTPDDFNSEDEGNVFLGCSHTFGIGHHLENTWAYKVNQYVGGKFWNLGIGGTGVMTHYRILSQLYKKLKIKNIFHFAPPYCRYEFYVSNNPVSFNVINIEDDKIGVEGKFIKMGEFLENSLINNDQMKITYETHINAIKWLAHEIGCDYYMLDTCRTYEDENTIRARDLRHFSVPREETLSKNFIMKYKRKHKIYN